MKMKWFPLLAGLLMVSASVQAWYGGPMPPWYGPYGEPEFPSASPGYQRAPSIRVQTRRAADGYLVNIQLQGMTPDDVTLTRSGRWLVVEKVASEERTDQGEGSYSYSRSFGTVRRQITLPRNADLDAMVREDGEHEITLSIPLRYR